MRFLLRIEPILVCFPLLIYAHRLGRSNLRCHALFLHVGNARVAGLQKQLGLTDQQYQICVTVLFVYVLHWPNRPMPMILTTFSLC